MLEFYTAYFDCRDVIDMTEELVAAAAERVVGERSLRFEDRPLSLKPPFARLRMVDAIFGAVTAGEAALSVESSRHIEDPGSLEGLVHSSSFEALCDKRVVLEDSGEDLLEAVSRQAHRPPLRGLGRARPEDASVDPTFVIDYPVEISPLAKRRADHPEVADRFELFIAGMEIANGFSELNDPLEQRERFLDQLRRRERGDPKRTSWTTTTSEPSATACRRRVGAGSASTGWP